MLNVLIAVVIVAALFIVGLWLLRRRYPNYTVVQLGLWYSAKFLVRFLWRAKQPKRLPIPDGTGAVIVCNHRSSIDPFFIQTIAERPIRFMVAREYCEHWMFRWFLRNCEVIPVGRGGIDTAATKTAIRHAANGGVVGMLPEGRINTTDQFMLPVRPGAILVALRARVPILPCYIEGAPYGGTAASPLFMRARVRVVFGEPFDLSPYYDREGEEGLVAELTIEMVKRIAHLAGLDDFQPTLAGRKWKPLESEFANGSENGLNGE